MAVGRYRGHSGIGAVGFWPLLRPPGFRGLKRGGMAARRGRRSRAAGGRSLTWPPRAPGAAGQLFTDHASVSERGPIPECAPPADSLARPADRPLARAGRGGSSPVARVAVRLAAVGRSRRRGRALDRRNGRLAAGECALSTRDFGVRRSRSQVANALAAWLVVSSASPSQSRPCLGATQTKRGGRLCSRASCCTSMVATPELFEGRRQALLARPIRHTCRNTDRPSR